MSKVLNSISLFRSEPKTSYTIFKSRLVGTEVEVEEDEGVGVKLTTSFEAFEVTYRINLESLFYCFAMLLRVITLSHKIE
ncbi:1693_t:CDS:1, partial [Funneliformis geosporum]